MLKNIRGIEIGVQPDKGARATAGNGDVVVTINDDYRVFEYLNPEEALRLAAEIRVAAAAALKYEQDLADYHIQKGSER